MLEYNITILPSNFQINPSNNRQDCEMRTATPGNRFRDLEKVYDGDYDCYRNHNHERAKNACEERLTNEAEKTVGFHNLPSGFAVHHVLCFGTIVVHNSLSFADYYSWLSFLFSSMSVTFFAFAFTTRTMPRIIQKMGPAGLWPAVIAPRALMAPRTIEIIPNVFMIL